MPDQATVQLAATLVLAFVGLPLLAKITYDMGRIAGALSDAERVKLAMRELLKDDKGAGSN